MFALVSDTHIGSRDATNDLRKTVSDINTQPEVAFVVFAGDITEMGSDGELKQAKAILDSLKKPWYILPGNHDTKWSESGNNSFTEIFGDEKFAFEKSGYLFIGCSSGPNMRMGPGLVPREHLVWLDSVVTEAAKTKYPIVFLNHYPLDEGLANWYQVIEILKKGNIQVAICGHGHRNRKYDFEGFPGVMARSNLTTQRDTVGYNLVTLTEDSLYFKERISKQYTKKTWATLPLQEYIPSKDTTNYPRPDFSLNSTYPGTTKVWMVQDSSDIAAGMVHTDGFIIYTNTAGYIKALDATEGKLLWKFKTKGKIYATPAVSSDKVVVASADGSIYALQWEDGSLAWKFPTRKAIVASPVTDESRVYCASSEGVFRALDLKSGELIWENKAINGFVETVPLQDESHLYFGDWNNHFYALRKKDGQISWTWTTEKGRLYSPAACQPVKANDKVFVVAPDRFTTALDAQTGEVVWRNNQPIGRESIGLSEDRQLLYIQNMHDSIHAFHTTTDTFSLAWSVDCGFGYEIGPSPLVEKGGLIFVPTHQGILYAVDKARQKVAWVHKLSHGLVNPVLPLDNGSLIISTMDGKIARLSFPTGPSKTMRSSIIP
jgi:outer membrane protein assembly factor BamB/Icc-related predicted phosphoesterase